MRTRIALATAVAVIIAIPTLLFTFFGTTPAGSVGTTRHEAIGLQNGGAPHHVVHISDKVMSYAQARKVAQMVAYANAVQAQKEATFIEDLAFFQAVAAQQRQAAAQAAAAQAAAANAAAAAAAATPAVPAPTAPATGSSDATTTNTPDWACIRQHESGDDYGAAGGGAYQFEDGTWTSLTGLPGPAQSYPPATQDAAALELYSQRAWEPWTTRYVCGL